MHGNTVLNFDPPYPKYNDKFVIFEDFLFALSAEMLRQGP